MRFFLGGRLPLGLFGGVLMGGDGQHENTPRTGRVSSNVYVVSNGQGQFKIGMSTNPEARIKSLQTGSPHKLEIVYLLMLKDGAAEVEAKAHEYLYLYSINGEWFDCKKEDAILAVNKAAEVVGKTIVSPESISMEVCQRRFFIDRFLPYFVMGFSTWIVIMVTLRFILDHH